MWRWARGDTPTKHQQLVRCGKCGTRSFRPNRLHVHTETPYRHDLQQHRKHNTPTWRPRAHPIQKYPNFHCRQYEWNQFSKTKQLCMNLALGRQSLVHIFGSMSGFPNTYISQQIHYPGGYVNLYGSIKCVPIHVFSRTCFSAYLLCFPGSVQQFQRNPCHCSKGIVLSIRSEVSFRCWPSDQTSKLKDS